MPKSPLSARVGAVCFILWGLAHVAGGALQVSTLLSDGPGALTAMIATAAPQPAEPYVVAAPAAAFMGMGAWNVMWIGAFVTAIGVGMNWRNSKCGYLINMGVVGATDLGLVVALLQPGYMSWVDGSVGLVLFGLAATFSTLGLLSTRGARAA